MTKTMKQFSYTLAGSSLIPAIWAIGWILYDTMEIWRTVTNIDYQNILLAIMGLQMFCWMIAVTKAKQPLTTLDKKELNKIFQRANKKLTPQLDKHSSELGELKERVADLAAALKMAPEPTAEVNR